MSSMYCVGTIEKNDEDKYILTKPVVMSGIGASFVEGILEKSEIDIYCDFNYVDSDSIEPLFYAVDKAWSGPLNEKHKESYVESICMEYVAEDSFPLICDGVDRNGLRICVNSSRVTIPNYDKFKVVDKSLGNIRRIMSEDSYYLNNNEDWLVELILKNYETIASFIEDGKVIYWYKSC